MTCAAVLHMSCVHFRNLMLFRIEHLRAFFAFAFLRLSVSLWVLSPRQHVSEQPAALQCAHSHPSAMGRAVIATAEIPGAPWSSGDLTRDCLVLLMAFLVLRSRAETNHVGLSQQSNVSHAFCVCSHYLQQALLPPVQLQLLAAMGSISWTCEECYRFYLCWKKISFISLIITHIVIITHGSDSVVGIEMHWLSLKGKESTRKRCLQLYVSEESVWIFLRAQYHFTPIKVNVNIICNSIGALPVSKYGKSSVLEFFCLLAIWLGFFA